MLSKNNWLLLPLLHIRITILLPHFSAQGDCFPPNTVLVGIASIADAVYLEMLLCFYPWHFLPLLTLHKFALCMHRQ